METDAVTQSRSQPRAEVTVTLTTRAESLINQVEIILETISKIQSWIENVLERTETSLSSSLSCSEGNISSSSKNEATIIKGIQKIVDEFTARLGGFKREILKTGDVSSAGLAWGCSPARGSCECAYDSLGSLTFTEKVGYGDGEAGVDGDDTGIGSGSGKDEDNFKIKLVFRGYPFHCKGRDIDVFVQDEAEVEALKAAYSRKILNIYTYLSNVDKLLMDALELESVFAADVEETRYDANADADDDGMSLLDLMRQAYRDQRRQGPVRLGSSSSSNTTTGKPFSLEAPEEIVQKHIRLLKEYNDMKDIGQQMIGLVAENRGVRIGSLYDTGEYGVTADD